MSIITESLICESEDPKSVTFNNTQIIDLTLVIVRSLDQIKTQNFQDIDTQSLFLHHFILNICECLRKTKAVKYVFYLNILLPQVNDLDRNICLAILTKTLKKMHIPYIDYPQDLNYFINKLTERSDNELILFETKIIKLRNKKSFKSIMVFLKQNGLTFLHDTYFMNPSNKLLLFR